jgi:hypothetical protein
MAKYIYGVICNQEAGLFDAAGFEREVRVTTPECREVSAIGYQDIAAVVSESAISDHTHLLRDALARLLVRHQMVVETVMSLGYTVIPLKLGTFANDEPEVSEILRRGYRLIRAIHPQVASRIEVDVVTTWSDLTLILKEIAERSEIRQLKAELQANPAGVSVEDQMRLGVMVKKFLDQTRADLAQEIHTALKSHSADMREHDLMDDKMVSNAAFLLDRTRQARFDQTVKELDARFLGRLNFRCVGPLPAYSFYTLEARKLQFDRIDWARRKLGLVKDAISRDEIRTAHRRLAFSAHPDRNAGSLLMGREFDEITNAYRILDEYCQDDRCSFDPASLQENTIQVRVRS